MTLRKQVSLNLNVRGMGTSATLGIKDRVRTLRPGSIETLGQVNVIREFAQQLRR